MTQKLKQIVSIAFLALLLIWLIAISFPIGGETKVMNHKDPSKSYEPPFSYEGDVFVYNQQDSLLAKLNVEFAETPQEINYGMMYRKSIPENSGMLFLMPVEEPQSFWMKNTRISLDVIYLNSQGKVVSLQKNTEPNSEKHLPSVFPAAMVLEVEAGFADKHSLSPGDKISYHKL